MKLPEKGPNWFTIFSSNADKFIGLLKNEEIVELFKKANKHYVSWDRFKYFAMPQDVSPDLAWALLKFHRTTQSNPLDKCIDVHGKPFTFWLPEFAHREIHFIDKNSGGQVLTDSPSIAAERDRYLISSLMEEAIASSILEGAVATREQAKAMLRSSEKPKTRSEQMIVNNYNTMRSLKKYASRPLTPELIKEIQASITKDTLGDPNASGRFKKEGEENFVMDNENQVLFTPPPVKEIDDRIRNLCDFVNKDGEFVHPVIKAIILHFWLAYIHPFVDGNGRTARSLFYWYMIKQDYWLIEFLSISRILVKAPMQYARAYLYTELDDRDTTYFIHYHLRAICLAIKELREYLKLQQKKIDQSNQFIKRYPGLNPRQRGFILHSLTHPGERYGIEYYKNMHQIVYQTARTDLLVLVKKGLFENIREGNKFYFIPSKKIHDKLSGK